MKAIDVLVRIDGQQQPAAVDVGGQRQLYQDAVDRRIGVEPSHELDAAPPRVVSAGRW